MVNGYSRFTWVFKLQHVGVWLQLIDDLSNRRNRRIIWSCQSGICGKSNSLPYIRYEIVSVIAEFAPTSVCWQKLQSDRLTKILIVQKNDSLWRRVTHQELSSNIILVSKAKICYTPTPITCRWVKPEAWRTDRDRQVENNVLALDGNRDAWFTKLSDLAKYCFTSPCCITLLAKLSFSSNSFTNSLQNARNNHSV